MEQILSIFEPLQVIKYLTYMLSLNWWQESKTKLFKYQGTDAKKKFMKDQTQNSMYIKNQKHI